MSENLVDAYAKIIWEYHLMHQQLIKADCIFALCSNDIRVAEWASELYLKHYAPYILFSGGLGDLTANLFAKSEAEIFADIAREKGVPDSAALIENKATNTGENIRFTQELLKEKNFSFDSFILVQKPYMERRTYATFAKQWPGKSFVVTSPPMSYEEAPTNDVPKDMMINVMMGDLARIKEYPKQGFQIEQDIPEEVWSAYEQLKILGYPGRLMR